MRRLKNVDTTWSSRLAYAIGLIASDGNLSPDGRHINLTSKDLEIILLFKDALCLKNKIGRKGRGYTKEKKYYCIQFGDINFYEFLLTIGLIPAKSKTLGHSASHLYSFVIFFGGVLMEMVILMFRDTLKVDIYNFV